MVFNFFSVLSKTRKVLNNIYTLFFAATAIFIGFLLLNFPSIIIADSEPILTLILAVVFVFVLLVFYGVQGAYLNTFCKIQENVSLDDYIGSLTNQVIGKVFKYALLASSALFATVMMCALFYVFDVVGVENTGYFVSFYFFISHYISLIVAIILSIGIAYLRSRSNSYNYNAVKKELIIGSVAGGLIGLLFHLVLYLEILQYETALLLGLGFVALMFCIAAYNAGEISLNTIASETRSHKITYIFIVGTFVLLFWLFSTIGFAYYFWRVLITLTILLSLIAAAIFAVAYIRAYLQDVARRYRQY